ncbi:hypothetical protein H8959_016781 [Pygathrix nigripes]
MEQPGEPVTEFSCRELEAGSLVCDHRGGPAQHLTFWISDGLHPRPGHAEGGGCPAGHTDPPQHRTVPRPGLCHAHLAHQRVNGEQRRVTGLTIQRATVWMLQLEPLHTQDTQQDTLTTAHLEATLEEAGPSPPTFHYEVVQAPRKGSLQLQGTRLSRGQGFTQDDVQAGQVTCGATARTSVAVEDTFCFCVTAPPYFSLLCTFSIHTGGDPDMPVLTNVLVVAEDDEGVLSTDQLFQSLNSARYLYKEVDLAWDTGQDHSGDIFTNGDLLCGRLVYQHDDSEITEGDIPFVATRQDESSGDMVWEEIISHVFHVARGRWRLLTTVDVAFSSADLGFADAQLVLTHKDLLFGSIMAMDEPMQPIYCFIHEGPQEEGQLLRATQPATVVSQQYLLNGAILYGHNGSLRPYSTLAFSMEAGPLHTDATLQVTVALEGPLAPLKLAQHKKIYIFQREAAEVRRDQLEVLEPSWHGALQKEDGPHAKTLSAFCWREGSLGPDCQPWACPSVEEQLICYVHEGSETLTDSFVLMANVSEMDRQSHPVAFTVTILPVSGQPPNLTTNSGLQGPSSHSAARASEAAPVQAPTSSFCSYCVVRSPQLGRLFHAQHDSTGEDLVNFTQPEPLLFQQLLHLVQQLLLLQQPLLLLLSPLPFQKLLHLLQQPLLLPQSLILLPQLLLFQQFLHLVQQPPLVQQPLLFQ